MKITALIPAAGQGKRMGGPGNKQYLLLGGRPILAHTVDVFQNHSEVDEIILVVPEAEVEFCRLEIVKKYGFDKVSALIRGGRERQDSVRLGLEAVIGAPEDLVLVHDGARPFIHGDLVSRIIAETRATGACLTAVPVKDTIKAVSGGRVEKTLPRQVLWQAQTPQGFRCGLLRRAHAEALRDGIAGTDDAALVERLGHPVAVVDGDYHNLKITTPDDLVAAEALLAAREENDP